MGIIDAALSLGKNREDDVLARLTTVWGENLDTEHILEEYPRPQMKRNNYAILNGYWNYAITDSPAAPSVYDGRILVPFSPESLLSQVERQLLPDEYLWYERTLFVSAEEYRSLRASQNGTAPDGSSKADSFARTAPNASSKADSFARTAPNASAVTDAPSPKRLLIHFGAVDQYATVYLNGKAVCSHSGGYLPFEADLTPFLREGANSLSLCVQDVSDTSYHSRGKQTLKRGGMFYTAQSGIWQTVWTEYVPENYIRKIYLTPDFDKGEIGLRIIASTQAQVPVAIRIYAGKECIYHGACKTAKGNRFSANIKLSQRHPWTPETPFLYQMRIQYGEDTVDTYFALRCFTTEPDENGRMRFCLNHKPYFLHGVLDQGYWPDGLYTAPSDAALIYDIRAMKKLGFNMMRKHVKIESARWYYHCDRLGMVVWQDMVSGGSHYSLPMVCYFPTLFPILSNRTLDNDYKLFGRSSKAGRREWQKECMETIDYLYNVPSLAVWVPFNEGWGQFDAAKIAKEIKAKDPTRPVDHASGWFDQRAGDFKSVHNYFRKLKTIRDPRAFALSEYGGYACHVQGHSSVERIFGYRTYATCAALTRAYRSLTDKVIPSLVKKGLSAAVYTQVADVEEEVNGLLTYDRKICKIKDIILL